MGGGWASHLPDMCACLCELVSAAPLAHCRTLTHTLTPPHSYVPADTYSTVAKDRGAPREGSCGVSQSSHVTDPLCSLIPHWHALHHPLRHPMIGCLALPRLTHSASCHLILCIAHAHPSCLRLQRTQTTLRFWRRGGTFLLPIEFAGWSRSLNRRFHDEYHTTS